MFSYFRKKPESIRTNNVSKQGFTNQEDILKEVNASDEVKGICSELANLYTKYQLGHGTREFLEGTPKEIYQFAENEHHQQETLFLTGQDATHSAFSTTNTPYNIHIVDASQLTAENIAHLVQQSPHSIISFPEDVGTTDTYFHQVAVGKNKNGECYSFDADFDKGERIHACNNFNEIANKISLFRSKKEKKAIVAVEDTKLALTNRHR